MEPDRQSAPHAQAGSLTWLVGIVAAVCTIWLIRAASVVAIPLVAAFFLAIIVHPVQVYLHERLGRFRRAALPLTLALLVAVIGGAIWALAESVDEAVEAAPQYRERVREQWENARSSLSDAGFPVPENLLGSADVQQRLASAGAAAVRIVWEAISGLVLVFFLVLLMLIEAPIWSANTRRVLHDGHGREMLDTIGGIATKIRQYLYVRTILGLASAVAAAVWLLILDVDLVLVWVVLTFLLNYIPNLGSIIAVVPPSLMAVIQYGPTYGLVTLGGLTVLEQVIGNYIDPRMQGRRLRLSPVVVLAALVFWTWMWGPVGALLAVPVTVALLAAAAHVPALRPLSILAEADDSANGADGARHAA